MKNLENLLKNYQNGDVEAFEEFFRRTEKLIARFLTNMLRNRSDAEDAFQETYFRIHKAITKYDANRDALNWVFAIARNAGIDRIRKRSNHEELTEAVERAAVINKDDSDMRDLIFEALGALSADEKNLIHLRFVEGHSYAEIAKAKDLTEENSRKKISRIVKKMKTTVGF